LWWKHVKTNNWVTTKLLSLFIEEVLKYKNKKTKMAKHNIRQNCSNNKSVKNGSLLDFSFLIFYIHFNENYNSILNWKNKDIKKEYIFFTRRRWLFFSSLYTLSSRFPSFLEYKTWISVHLYNGPLTASTKRWRCKVIEHVLDENYNDLNPTYV